MWWKRFRRSCAWQEFLVHVHPAPRGTSSPSNLADFIAGKTTSIVSAISYDSNFVFSLTGNAKSTLKNIGAASPEASGNQSCALRACKPICQFYGAAAPKNGVGEIVGTLFSPKVVRFPADIVTYWSSMFFSRREFRSSIIDWMRTIRKVKTIFGNEIITLIWRILMQQL